MAKGCMDVCTITAAFLWTWNCFKVKILKVCTEESVVIYKNSLGGTQNTVAKRKVNFWTFRIFKYCSLKNMVKKMKGDKED